MEKLYTYMMITVFMMSLLYVFGITPNALFGIGSPEDLQNYQDTPIFHYMIYIGIGLLVALGLTAYVTKTVSDLPITAGLALALLTVFIGNIASVTMYSTETWEKYLIFLITFPFVMGYSIALWDWIRGKD